MLEWLSSHDPSIIYAFLVLNAFFESIFPPYPSDAFVLVFSFLAGQGNYSALIIYIATVIGSIGGMMVLYALGRSKGDWFLDVTSRTVIGKIFPHTMIQRAKGELYKRGPLFSTLNRFLPGMRAPLCFASGIVKIKPAYFFVYSLLSVIGWNLFLVVAGFYVGSTWHEASSFLRDYNIAVIVILLVILAALTILYFRKRNKS